MRGADDALVRGRRSTRGGAHLVRAEIGEAIGERGERLAHAIMLAELRGLVCSGPLRGPHHTYALVSERVPPTSPRDRDEALRELVHRFFAGHGPASVAHMARWVALTRAEIRGAMDDRLHVVRAAGQELWFDPEFRARPRPGAAEHAFLLPVVDEAYLTYPGSNLPRTAGHPRGEAPHRFAEAGGGVVVCDLRDAGWWTRRVSGSRMHVTPARAKGLDPRQRERIDAAAAALASAFGLSAVLTTCTRP